MGIFKESSFYFTNTDTLKNAKSQSPSVEEIRGGQVSRRADWSPQGACRAARKQGQPATGQADQNPIREKEHRQGPYCPFREAHPGRPREFKKKRYTPVDLRQKKNRAFRRRLTPFEKKQTTAREKKRAANAKVRKYALAA